MFGNNLIEVIVCILQNFISISLISVKMTLKKYSRVGKSILD